MHTDDPSFPRSFPGTERFRPRRLLGQGTMGLVYLVHDREIDDEVALKTLPTASPDRVYQLKQEFRTLAGITHEHLVELYELFVDEAQCFFTMEYVPGVAFNEHAAHRRAGHGDGVAAILAAARQLALGVMRVHAAGRVHRDVKPSNVLVTGADRVVLLDFGLSRADGADEYGFGPHRSLAGTPAYFAPEQAWGAPPHPSADWYALGVMLFEALIGRLPYEGSAAAMLIAKQSRPPPTIRAVAPGLPAAIGELVAALLDRDPQRRPTGEAVVAALDRAIGVEPQRPPTRAAAVDTRAHPFIGREAELDVLATACTQMDGRAPVVVHVEGPSGIGKSELVRRFLARAGSDAQLVALRGRCHPQESVPYKALDAIVDGLSRLLLSWPPDEVRAVVPRHPRALRRLFPVMSRVTSFAADEVEDDPPEAFERRRRAFAALRELLRAISMRVRLALWIDDFQWADSDSAALLEELLRPPDAPALLVLLSFRSEDRDRVADLLREAADGGTPPTPHHAIRLGGLPSRDAAVLARRLCATLADDIAPDGAAEVIVAEAAGSPFFIAEMARLHASRRMTEVSGGRHAGSPVRLADVLDVRIGDLRPRARQLLEVVAVAGWPTTRPVALAAAALEEADRPLFTALVNASLLRATNLANEPAFEVYHDRIRESVIQSLPADRRRRHHRAIADTLRARGNADVQALYEHYRGADAIDLARRYAVEAADAAAAVLAFARATSLYRDALALGVMGTEGAEVHERLAAALQASGRGTEAAQAFEQAAVEHASLDGDAGRILRLRQRASEQFVRSGAIERGLAMLRSVLAELDIALPATQRAAVAAAAIERLRFIVRGSALAEERPAAHADRERWLLDAYWSAAASLTMVDPILADSISVRGLRKALDLGNRSYAIRGLGPEVAREAALGGRFFAPRSRRLIADLEQIAKASGDPYDLGWLHQSIGGAAYLAGHWRVASEQCRRAADLWRARCVGAAWEIVTAESFGLSALAYMGHLRTLAELLPAAIADGDQREDVYAASGFRMGILNLHWLAQDGAREARDVNDQAVARWPRDRFLLQHFLHLVGALHIDLYEGNGLAAHDRITAAWPALRRAHLLSLGSARIELRHFRARAALAAAVAVRDGASTPRGLRWTIRGLLWRARLEARKLAAERLPPGPLYAACIRAGLAAFAERRTDTIAHLERAVRAADHADMRLYGAAAALQLARARGGDQGAAEASTAEAAFAAEGVARPDAFTAMLLPGVGTD